MKDVAFRSTRRGRLDFAKNAGGDFYLDDRGVYSGLATLFAHRGKYAFDASVGTFLFSVRKDGRTTGTRIKSAVDDALSQCVSDELMRDAVSSVARVRGGAWSIALMWHTTSGDKVTEGVTL